MTQSDKGVASAAQRIRAGRPLVAFTTILLLWLGARIVLWESPFTQSINDIAAAMYDSHAMPNSVPAADLTSLEEHAENARSPLGEAASWRQSAYSSYHQMNLQFQVAPSATAQGTTILVPASTPREVVHEWSRLQKEPAASPAKITRGIVPATVSLPPSGNGRSEVRRWSFDSWVFLRQGGDGAQRPGANLATYGTSQAGAIIRRRLSTAGSLDATAYMRTTATLSGAGQYDFAGGLSVKPVSEVPAILAGELRASRVGDQTYLRPAILVVSTLETQKLPFDLRASPYVQAGYVGGEFATPFLDGRLILDSKALEVDAAKVRAGVGTWIGAQKGVSRIDIGPSLTTDLNVADLPVNVTIDYRHRVAGDAEPESGVALTVSTSF